MSQFNLALYHQTQGYLVSAESGYKLALQGDVDFVGAHVQLGEILAEQKRLGEAMPHWQKALELDPSCGVADLYMGHALGAAGRVDEAIASVQRAGAAGPRDPRPQWVVGNLRIGVGRMNES